MRVLLTAVALISLLSGCASPDRGKGLVGTLDEDGFWAVVERTRVAGDGDLEAMSEALYGELEDADDEQLVAFETHYVQTLGRLGSWRHAEAAEVVCGFISDDVFVDYRTWVLTRGRDVVDAVAADPDALADVPELDRSCEEAGLGELYGSVAAQLYAERTGEEFPESVPSPFGAGPTGERSADADAVRAALPRLAERYPDDGLGRGPIER